MSSRTASCSGCGVKLSATLQAKAVRCPSCRAVTHLQPAPGGYAVTAVNKYEASPLPATGGYMLPTANKYDTHPQPTSGGYIVPAVANQNNNHRDYVAPGANRYDNHSEYAAPEENQYSNHGGAPAANQYSNHGAAYAASPAANRYNNQGGYDVTPAANPNNNLGEYTVPAANQYNNPPSGYAAPAANQYNNPPSEYGVPAATRYNNPPSAYGGPAANQHGNQGEYGVPAANRFNNPGGYAAPAANQYDNQGGYVVPAGNRFNNPGEYVAPPPKKYSNQGGYGAPAANQFNNNKHYPASPYGQYQQPLQVPAQILPLSMHGPKRALLIGVSYNGHDNYMKGSVYHVNSMKSFLVQRMGFPPQCVYVLTEEEEDPTRIPTKRNIQKAMRWLIDGCQSGDSLVFYFSGHAAKVRDRDGDEIDGYDECLCPVDYDTEGKIIDDEINAVIVRPLPHGAKLHAIIDTPSRGSLLDLRFICKINRQGYCLWEDHSVPHIYKGTKGGLAISFSASSDHQYSDDPSAFTGGLPSGTMTYSFINAMETAPRITYGGLLSAIRYKVNENPGRVASPILQEPQLSASEKIDVHSMPVML